MSVFPVGLLVEGLAQWLQDEGLGSYRPDTEYQAGERAITARTLPREPDWAVAIAPYQVDDATTLPTQAVMVQLRFRAPAVGPRTSVDEWADQVAGRLHFRHNFDVGGVHVSRAQRVLVAPLGSDESGREERADSYEIIVTRP